MPIARAVPFTILVLAATPVAVMAQVPSSEVAPGRPDPYARDPYITSSGATVPNPGKPQAGPTTPQERAIQREDNKIDRSICKGC